MSVTLLRGLFSDLYTSAKLYSRRLKVDAQPTSFEANTQFKIFYRLQSVPFASQVVIKFESVNALNIMVRKINLWEGGREYLVYGDDVGHTNTGTFTALPIYNVNSNLSPNNDTHPVSEVDASIAIGAGIFTPAVGALPSNGDGVLTDSNANRANNQPLSDSNQSGVAENSIFYLVFNHIGQNDVSNGQFFLQWEELF